MTDPCSTVIFEQLTLSSTVVVTLPSPMNRRERLLAQRADPSARISTSGLDKPVHPIDLAAQSEPAVTATQALAFAFACRIALLRGRLLIARPPCRLEQFSRSQYPYMPQVLICRNGKLVQILLALTACCVATYHRGVSVTGVSSPSHSGAQVARPKSPNPDWRGRTGFSIHSTGGRT